MENNKLQIRNSTVEFLIFTKQNNKNTIEVRIEDETVWLTQKLMGVLFEKGRSTIAEHLQNIFETGEIKESSVCRDFRHTAEDKKEYTTKFYNRELLDNPGKVTQEIAKAFAESEFEKYRMVQDQFFESDFDKMIKKNWTTGKEKCNA
jgi:hypothetical protein